MVKFLMAMSLLLNSMGLTLISLSAAKPKEREILIDAFVKMYPLPSSSMD